MNMLSTISILKVQTNLLSIHLFLPNRALHNKHKKMSESCQCHQTEYVTHLKWISEYFIMQNTRIAVSQAMYDGNANEYPICHQRQTQRATQIYLIIGYVASTYLDCREKSYWLRVGILSMADLNFSSENSRSII